MLSTLGTMYNTDTNLENQKPNLILFYNSNKGGTDTFDQRCRNYTVARKTNRWPLKIFYAILDHTGVNSVILYTTIAKKYEGNLDLVRLVERLPKCQFYHGVNFCTTWLWI